MEIRLIQFLLEKVRFVAEGDLPAGEYSIFGTGGGARMMREKLGSSPHAQFKSYIEHEHADPCEGFAGNPISANDAQGNIILGSKTTHYQFNQIKALFNNRKIDAIFIIDDYHSLRYPEQEKNRPNVALLGWHSTIESQAHGCRTLKNHFLSVGRNMVELSALDLASLNSLNNLEHAFIWNGQREFFRPLQNYLKNRGIPVTYLEAGFFPQCDYVYLDRRGVNQKCMLMDDDLSWIEASHLEKIRRVKESFLAGFRHLAAEYILVPLQVPDDANVINCSRFTSGMQEFIDYICDYYGQDETILFKEHPKDPNCGSYDFHGHRVSDRPFPELLPYAKRVHGITSSTLYEAALAGIEVISEGDSLLNRHPDNQEKMLAAMIDRQFQTGTKDLSYWLHRYSNFHPPSISSSALEPGKEPAG